jgi:hypothetical protein
MGQNAMTPNIDRETFLGWRAWRLSPELVPTLIAGGIKARIVWRPVATAAWEIVAGDRGLCSLPRFSRADEAKQAAWRALQEI